MQGARHCGTGILHWQITTSIINEISLSIQKCDIFLSWFICNFSLYLVLVITLHQCNMYSMDINVNCNYSWNVLIVCWYYSGLFRLINECCLSTLKGTLSSIQSYMCKKLSQNFRCKEFCTFLSHFLKVLFFGNEMIDDRRLFCRILQLLARSSNWWTWGVRGRAGLSATYGLCQYQM